MTTTITPPENVKRPRGRPLGSKTRKIKEKINYINQPLFDQENKPTYAPSPRAVRGIWRVADQRIREAYEVLESHPKMPAPWKRNIKAFLYRLMGRCPYQANWFWAIECIKRDLRQTKPKIIAPFAYFRECLLNPQKFKMQTTRETHAHIVGWLVKKGQEERNKRLRGEKSSEKRWGGAAWAYRYRHGLVTKAQEATYQVRKWQRTLSREYAADLASELDPAIRQHKAAAEAFKKKWEVEKQARQLMKAELATKDTYKTQEEQMEEEWLRTASGKSYLTWQGLDEANPGPMTAETFEAQVRTSLGLEKGRPGRVRTREQEMDLKRYLQRHPGLTLGITH